MALQVWLPLTKDLRQQGINSATIEEVTTAIFDNNGKLGKCLSGGKIKIPANQVASIFNNTSMSIAFWYNNNTSETTGNHAICGFSGNTEGDTDAVRIWDFFNYSVPTQFHWSMGTLGGGSLANAFPANTWVHVCVTWSAPTLKIYLDGVLKYTGSGSSNYTFNKSYYISFGHTPQKLNDFRIYNHCLSPMEVKKLSQGLVLHYPLSDKFLEGTTNLVTSITSGGQTTWANNILTTSGTNADTYFTLNLSENIVNGTQYTISCDAEDIPQGTCWTFPLGQQGNTALSFQIYNGHNEYTFTANNISWGTKRCFMDDGGSPNSARATGAKCKIYNFQIEKKDHATGFAGYGGTRNANTVYDCSGFVNNGTVSGSLTISNDTPKYQVSTHIGAASQKIHIPDLITSGFANTYSFAWWGKNTAFGNKMFWGFSNGIRLNGMYYGTLWNTGDGSNNPLYKIGTTTQVSAPSANTWHHYVMTGNGTKCYVYLDGELWAEAKTYKAISGTSIYINGWDSGTSYSYDNMDMSDFRIYATALSASDVKSLYQNCATIDPDGTIHGKIR